jgi:hypothetical protein
MRVKRQGKATLIRLNNDIGHGNIHNSRHPNLHHKPEERLHTIL